MIVKKFKEPVLGAEVIFLAGCGHTEVRDYLDKKRIKCGDQDFSDADGFVLTIIDTDEEGNSYSYLIWIRHANSLGSLIHECLHLTKKVFTDRGIQFNEYNDEMIAEYQQYWVERIDKCLT